MSHVKNAAEVPIDSRWEMEVEDGKLTVQVIVKDIRENFGRIDAEVTPVGGSGRTWVNTKRMRRIDTEGG